MHIKVDLDFAKEALGQVSNIAANLGIQEKLFDAGRIAAELYLAFETLNVADASQAVQLQQHLPKLIHDLERVCAWPSSTNAKQSILRSLIYEGTPQAKRRVQIGILNFVSDSPFIVKQYLEKLHHFSEPAVKAPKYHGGEKITEVKVLDVEEYPRHVNATLHSVLRKHTLCTCETGRGPSGRHDGRLRLTGDIMKIDGYITFDMLFSASSNTCDCWQDLQLMVSMNKGKKRVQYPDTSAPGILIPKSLERHQVILPNAFCRMIGAKLGSRICCRIEESTLHQLHRGSPIIQHAEPGPSVSLRDILGICRLSSRMKLILAYIIAWSFWQYYDSPWMNTKWSSDTIHFLPESKTEDGNAFAAEQIVYYASKPYFVINFSEEDHCFAEYCDEFSVVYRYPRMIALAIILLEISRGQSLQVEETGSTGADLNRNWELAQRLVRRSKLWEGFAYPQYHQVVASLLDERLFDNCSIDELDAAADADRIITRKAIVYNVVVAPLGDLIKSMGFSDNIYGLGPMDSTSRDPVVKIPPPAPLHQGNKSAQWLDNLVQISQNIHQLSRQRTHDQKISPIKIAVLDTGYDCESAFFHPRIRQRHLKGWKDLVASSKDPLDENGHGTHTVSLIMKVAPLADIYVARVAKDPASLGDSVQHVNDAILWAVDECNADIISMSFGFNCEKSCISNTIINAELRRNRRVLFFAAASNSGANQKEMFPASHDSVISIRETNSNGAFSDTNPPVDPHGPIVYGTLGRDVPSAWLHSCDEESIKSGSSVATAVSVGIAAVVLQYAAMGLSHPTSQMPAQVEKLWTRKGMLCMFFKLSQNMGNRCFFISPSRFFSERDEEGVWAAMREHKPDGALQIGNIIADPFRPAKVLSKAPVDSSLATDSVTEYDHESSIQQSRKSSIGVWVRFLQFIGVKIPFIHDASCFKQYLIDRLETQYLCDEPFDNDPNILLRLAEPRV
ncbi:hypothetical protein J3E69DRAFT_382661 [Trichoderma sp. SZMC 28015]